MKGTKRQLRRDRRVKAWQGTSHARAPGFKAPGSYKKPHPKGK